MVEPTPHGFTAILNETAAEHDAPGRLDRILPVVYDELRQMAGRRLKSEGASPTLTPTELVHEAYLRLADATRITDRGRSYFFAAAARAMRRIVVDHARHKGRAKRGGGATPVTLYDDVALSGGPSLDVLELEDGLEQLTAVSERAAQVVECRFYGGLSVDGTAEALDVTPRTVNRDWAFARAFLFDHLRGEPGSPGPDAGTPGPGAAGPSPGGAP